MAAQLKLFQNQSTQDMRLGDCLDIMRSMESNSITHILTDPPYGLHFMGKDWDKFNKANFDESNDFKQMNDRSRRSIYTGNSVAGSYDESRNDEFQQFIYEFGKEALRIVKPGGFILMFGAPRRYHRQASGLEDAGWEIRDCLMWIFGQGFPKSHNHFGFEGYGTALKPAYEPIIMAMKPLDGTFAQNAEKHGVAGINIDGCRIGTDQITTQLKDRSAWHGNNYGNGGYEKPIGESESRTGRWPANVLFDEEAAKLLDEQSGNLKSGSGNRRPNGGGNMFSGFKPINAEFESSSGGASRFFYCAKASSSERNKGLEDLPLKPAYKFDGGPKINQWTGKLEQEQMMKNNHPTVKPIKLMEYLLKLITPPKDGIVLDPFAGSGTTLIAAKNLDINAIGIEKCPEYYEIAKKRIENA